MKAAKGLPSLNEVMMKVESTQLCRIHLHSRESRDQSSRCSFWLSRHPFLISKPTGEGHKSQVFTGQRVGTQARFARMTLLSKNGIFLLEGLDGRRRWQPDGNGKGKVRGPVRSRLV